MVTDKIQFIKDVKYAKRRSALELTLFNEVMLILPIQAVDSAVKYTNADFPGRRVLNRALQHPVILPDGLSIGFTDPATKNGDGDRDLVIATFYVPDVVITKPIRDRIIREWAKSMGSIKTGVKSESSRKNGRKGGRPAVV